MASDPGSDQLGRVIDALDEARGRPARFAAAAELPVVLSELEQWLGDERQWVSGYSNQWTSLLDDIQSARKATGATFSGFLGTGDRAEVWGEIAGVRRALKRHRRGGPDPVLRRRLSRVAQALRAALLQPEALLAAWEDLINAKSDEVALRRAYTLLALGAEQGLDGIRTSQILLEVLRNYDYRIANLRGEERIPRFQGFADRADASVEERFELCRKVLTESAANGKVVIWLRYLLAPLGEGRIIRLSEAVAIYSQDSLREAWISGERELLPPELRDGKRPHNLATMAQIPDEKTEVEADEQVSEKADDRPPFALIRIDLGEVRVAEALALARETAELLVSLAVLHGADPVIWLLTDDHVTFRDGETMGATFSAPPVFKPTLEQQSAMVSDRLPFVLSQWAEQLAPHLPLTRPDLRHAARLAYWMRRARETWEPGRLVLYDRIFEQVAGWAGFTDLGRFIDDCLRPSWPLGRIRNEITGCWSAIHNAGTGPLREISEEAWCEIALLPELEYVPLDDGGWEVNLKGVLLTLESILVHLDEQTALYERVETLAERTSSAESTLKWLENLDADFLALSGRSRRLRNALVHGGLVGEQAARSVLPFVESLATDALHTALDGLLGGEADLIGHFITRRSDQLRVIQRLRAKTPPAEALFW